MSAIINGTRVSSGDTVIYTGSAASLRTGDSFTVERATPERIYVRNLNGEVRPYGVNGFRLPESGQAGQPLQVTPPPAGLAVRVDVPADSPERFTLLSDNTWVNPTGRAQFNGNSSVLSTGTAYEIVEIRRGTSSNECYFGVMVNGNVARYRASHFSNGIPNLNGNVQTTQASNSRANNRPTAVNDARGNAISEGSKIKVVSGSGGHNMLVGTLAEVVSVDIETGNLQVRPANISGGGQQREVRIRSSRVEGMTDVAYQAELTRQAELRANRSQTFNVEINGQTIRIPASNRDRAISALRQLAA